MLGGRGSRLRHDVIRKDKYTELLSVLGCYSNVSPQPIPSIMALQPAEEDEEGSEGMALKQGLLSASRVRVEEKILSLVYQSAEDTCIVLHSSSVGQYQRGTCKQLLKTDLTCRSLLYASSHDVFVGVSEFSLKVHGRKRQLRTPPSYIYYLLLRSSSSSSSSFYFSSLST